MPNTAAKQSAGKDANVFMLIAKGGTEGWKRRERSGERSAPCGRKARNKRGGGRKMEMIKR